ncbi:SagB/ThcOx family dehydrogenase [Haloarchaeobius sp. DYHT-AS-18]|uniref:SagB/ThcOx family dehydrogenase n=1 Tax=Haloarchaeobius sp. DYHT-AS-18 TaxID=3446117 RepID=UPI003EBE9BE3
MTRNHTERAERDARLSLAAQEHPAGRVDLTSTSSFMEAFRERAFRDGSVAALFHENTKFDRHYQMQSAMTSSDLPDGFSTVEQDYHGQETVSLPTPNALDCGLADVLARRRSVREFADRGVTTETLGTLLGHAVAPTAERDTGIVSETSRSYPSAGGLYPIEVYPVVSDGADIDAGTYYYSPREHALRVLERGGTGDRFTGCFMDEPFAGAIVDDAPVTFVLTGCLSRVASKYGMVGYRFALYEAGHLAQTLLLAATALGLGGVPLGSFLDDDLDQFLGVDGTNEATLYPIAVGHPQDENQDIHD